MVHRCCVPECNSTSLGSSASFHKFTTNKKLQKQWIHLIKRDTLKSKRNPHPFKVTKATKICSKHFIKDDFWISSERNRLKLNAVPKIFPWTKPEKSKSQDENVQNEKPTDSSFSSEIKMDNWDDFNSVEIKLEREELIIKDEPDEVTERCSPIVVNQFKTNPSQCCVGNLVKNEIKIDNCDDSQSFEIKLEQEELIIKDEPNEVTEENQSFVIMSETNLLPLSMRNCIVKTEEKMENNTNDMKLEDFIVKGEPEEVEDGHNQIHTGDGKKHFKCQQCNQGFKLNWLLQRHMLIHEEERPFKCQRCDKSFTQKDCLKIHLLVHAGKKLFKCQQCNKSFTRKGDLKTHLLVHDDKKSFECQQCNKSFKHNSVLKRHMLNHEEKRRFKCQHCDKNFNRNDHFKRHMVVHEDKKLTK